MPPLISMADVSTLIAKHSAARLIAIDGLATSGKTTLAKNLVQQFGYGLLEIDNFFIHTKDWPRDTKPSWPPPYFRNDDITKTITALAANGRATYYPFTWETMRTSTIPVTVTTTPPLIVEGTGVLSADLAGYFDLSFFVECDETSIFDTAMKRDGNYFIKEWYSMFIPCPQIYMQSRPQDRAHYRIAGRGIGF